MDRKASLIMYLNRLILPLLLAFGAANAEISDYAKEIAMEFAPVIWLHPDEMFNPSTTDFYIENMQLRDANEEVVQADPTASTILSGEGTEDLHLNTERDIQCVNCYEGFFYGQALDDISVYVHVHEYGDECNTVDVKYSVFYPFNFGKEVCVGLPDDQAPNGCRGFLATFGNHMSDWEGVQIRFRDGVPTDMELSAHSFGAWYTYDAEDNVYRYRDGEQLIPALDNDTELVGARQEDGDDNLIQLRIEYPQEVYMYEDTNHVEVFSALGSHGVWGQPGENSVVRFRMHELIKL